MSRSDVARLTIALFASAMIAACSFIADFDPGKLPKQAIGGADATAGASGAGGASATFAGGTGGAAFAGMGGVVIAGTGGNTEGVHEPRDASTQGGAAGTGMSGAGGAGTGGDTGLPPPACDVATNTGCAADELCCKVGQGATCHKTSLKECEQCGVACPTGLAAACTARKCECAPGSQRVCSGQNAERFCAAGPPAACAACRDGADCAGRTDGKLRCVAGQCAQCDPSEMNAGCSGKTPICDAATNTCKACTTSPDDCIKPLVCATGGACGHCGSAADCTTSTSPICDPSTTQCRPCANDGECVAGPKLPYCVSQTCSSCNPNTEAGCADPTKPDCRGDSSGGFSCQKCTNDSHCAHRAGTPVCDVLSGRCVACASDNDCTAANAPFCINNACAACDQAPYVTLVSDLRCALRINGQPACIHSAGTHKGQCGACDPGDSSRGCTTNQLCCETGGALQCIRTSTTQCTACASGACDPATANTCTNRACGCGSGAPCSGSGAQRFCLSSGCGECRNDADCTNPAVPLCENNACVRCNQAASANARCAAEVPGSVCATTGARVGRCSSCDPASNAGCADATLNQCDPATATCVDCVDNGGCSGALDRCNTSTHKCIDCDATGGCSDVPSTPICIASACTACTSDAQCASAPGAAGPLCAFSGACVPDGPCTKSAECTDGIHRVCAGLQVDGGGSGHCRVCDPATNAGCPGAQTCSPGFVCSG